ncbi:hypothetical protein HPB50_006245 [Hyalomma asiaticum]|uniref:Uncharacterized protein n=1 Tax=Hyalomma asiaticum TaxID=266040 RepID=A0ACB7TFV5_HYAAI|nr:hypothetical protein HPB50_006245 [Hyalomma asiaticum]
MEVGRACNASDVKPVASKGNKHMSEKQRIVGAAASEIVQVYKFDRRLKDAPQKPRRGATSHEEGLAIVVAVADNPRCSAQEIKVNFGLKASKGTVKRRLYQAGLKSRTAEQKVLLRTAIKDKRLQFAQRHAGWIEQNWKKVIFTDESTFTTCWDQKTRIRRHECTL